MSYHQLLDAEDSVLVVIDVQAAFAKKLETNASQALVSRIAWAVGVAGWFGLPTVVTAEDIPRLGSVADEVAHQLATTTIIYNKMTFDLTAEAQIVTAIQNSQKQTALLVGFETDVCVAQSAIGLLGLGYRVVALLDCTGSPGVAHAAGLQRMAGAGALVLPLRSVLYEWLRTVERTRHFREEYLLHNAAPEELSM